MRRTNLVVQLIAMLALILFAAALSASEPRIVNVEAVPPDSFDVTVNCQDCIAPVLRVAILPTGKWVDPGGPVLPRERTEIEFLEGSAVIGATVRLKNTLTQSLAPAVIDVWWGHYEPLPGDRQQFWFEGSTRCWYLGATHCEWGVRCLTRDASGNCLNDVERCVLRHTDLAGMDQWCRETGHQQCAFAEVEECP